VLDIQAALWPLLKTGHPKRFRNSVDTATHEIIPRKSHKKIQKNFIPEIQKSINLNTIKTYLVGG